MSIRFERCRREDLARVTAVERASYPADEAASATSLEMRQREAGEFFMVARAVDESMDSSGLERARASDASGTAAAALDADARSIVGYVCGTLASGDVLDESTMSSHDPSGDVLAIHSVCVDERFRRRGVAASAASVAAVLALAASFANGDPGPLSSSADANATQYAPRIFALTLCFSTRGSSASSTEPKNASNASGSPRSDAHPRSNSVAVRGARG